MLHQSLSTCRTCGGKLVKKETKRKASQLLQPYYYKAYYYCPACKKIYHSDAFKVVNKNYGLFTEKEIKVGDDEVKIWTDGACVSNGKENARAAWAFVTRDYEASGTLDGKQTNNRAEAFAIYHALVWAVHKGKKHVRVYTDSQITIHGLKKPAEKVKENRDIFESIEQLIEKNSLLVRYEKVLGHADDINNSRADHLANTRARSGSKRF